jgi:hypothetical protein
MKKAEVGRWGWGLQGCGMDHERWHPAHHRARVGAKWQPGLQPHSQLGPCQRLLTRHHTLPQLRDGAILQHALHQAAAKGVRGKRLALIYNYLHREGARAASIQGCRCCFGKRADGCPKLRHSRAAPFAAPMQMETQPSWLALNHVQACDQRESAPADLPRRNPMHAPCLSCLKPSPAALLQPLPAPHLDHRAGRIAGLDALDALLHHVVAVLVAHAAV